MFIIKKKSCSYVICQFKCSSSLKLGWFWLALNVFVVHQLEKNSEGDSYNIVVIVIDIV